jgi:hypothetical protein
MTSMGKMHVGSFASALINWDFIITLTLMNMMINVGKKGYGAIDFGRVDLDPP